MGIINIKHLVHKFKDNDENEEIITAIDGVDLDVEEGQFIAILGHNGSGKSSLAKHINALLAPTEGTVLISGMNTKDEKKIWEQVNSALKAVDMTAYRLHSPMKLSGGQKQRVAIAGIIAMEPKCIILDEPTAMLDPIGREEVISTLEELNKAKNITIILITHHMSETIHADKIFVMNKGKIELQGTPREVFSEVDKMKELGLEVPQVTELGFELQKEGLNIKNGTLEIDELVDEIVRVYNNN